MIKVYCDMCGKPIDFDVDGVNLTFSNYGIIHFDNPWNKDKNLCIACAKRVENWVDNECEKIKKELDGKGEGE